MKFRNIVEMYHEKLDMSSELPKKVQDLEQNNRSLSANDVRSISTFDGWIRNVFNYSELVLKKVPSDAMSYIIQRIMML